MAGEPTWKRALIAVVFGSVVGAGCMTTNTGSGDGDGQETGGSPTSGGSGGSGAEGGSGGTGAAPQKADGQVCACDDECAGSFCNSVDSDFALCTPPGARQICFGNTCFTGLSGRSVPCTGGGGSGSGGASNGGGGGTAVGGTNAGGDAGGGAPIEDLGEPCTNEFCTSEADWCYSSGSATCDSQWCVGSGAASYCSKPCASDQDCIPSATPMRCLTSCEITPDIAGHCWDETAYASVAAACGL